MTQLTPVVQAAAVGTVQPHVCGAAVVVVTDGPARHANTRSLIPPVLFRNIKLGGKDKDFLAFSVIFRSRIGAIRLKVSEQQQDFIATHSYLPGKAAGSNRGGGESVTFASRTVRENIPTFQRTAEQLVRVEGKITDGNALVLDAALLKHNRYTDSSSLVLARKPCSLKRFKTRLMIVVSRTLQSIHSLNSQAFFLDSYFPDFPSRPEAPPTCRWIKDQTADRLSARKNTTAL